MEPQQEPQDTTERRIDLIAQGIQELNRIPQLLKDTFDAQDYLTALRGYHEPQRYIDGLYQVIHLLLAICTLVYPFQDLL